VNVLNYHKTKFLKSFSQITNIDIQDGFEIAFIGYSNSGKSSVINSLTNQKKLARSSKTPGRTQLINFFEVLPDFRIVDLPGYGYTTAPEFVRKIWEKRIYHYLESRKQLKYLILSMDIRYPLKILDLKIINVLINLKKSVLVLLNKCDKFGIHAQNHQLQVVTKQLLLLSNNFQVQLFSSTKKIGIKKLQLILNRYYNNYLNV